MSSDSAIARLAADSRAWLHSTSATCYVVPSGPARAKMGVRAVAKYLGLDTHLDSCHYVFHYVVALRENKGKGRVIALLGLYKQDCPCKGEFGATFECAPREEEEMDYTDFIETTVTINLEPACLAKCVAALPRGLGPVGVGNINEKLLDDQWAELGWPLTRVDPHPRICPRGWDHTSFPEIITQSEARDDDDDDDEQ